MSAAAKPKTTPRDGRVHPIQIASEDNCRLRRTIEGDIAGSGGVGKAVALLRYQLNLSTIAAVAVSWNRLLRTGKATLWRAPSGAGAHKEVTRIAAAMLLHKRCAFKFEREVRLLWLDREGPREGFTIGIDRSNGVGRGRRC